VKGEREGIWNRFESLCCLAVMMITCQKGRGLLDRVCISGIGYTQKRNARKNEKRRERERERERKVPVINVYLW
jgi:hypothetical protein